MSQSALKDYAPGPSSGPGKPRGLPAYAPGMVIPEPPIAAWLHQGPISRPTVAVTFPGTRKAMSLTRLHVTRLRKALQQAELILARDDPQDRHVSIDLMKRISDDE